MNWKIIGLKNKILRQLILLIKHSIIMKNQILEKKGWDVKKTPNTSDLVNKTDYNTKTTEIVAKYLILAI